MRKYLRDSGLAEGGIEVYEEAIAKGIVKPLPLIDDDPAWRSFRHAITQAVKEHPEARATIKYALKRIEDG